MIADVTKLKKKKLAFMFICPFQQFSDFKKPFKVKLSSAVNKTRIMTDVLLLCRRMFII